MDDRCSVTDKAKQQLDQGLTACQKLIEIAHHSELGWKVLGKYQANKLAADSEAEKKLNKADKSAKRKAAKQWKAVMKPGTRGFKFQENLSKSNELWWFSF